MTGADGNFSAGADLDRLVGALTSGKPAEDEYEERIRQDFTLIYKGFLKDHYVQKPIIAAVEGYCYAGGMEILQAFDIRVVGRERAAGHLRGAARPVPDVGLHDPPAPPDPVHRRHGHAAGGRPDHGRARLRGRARRPPDRATARPWPTALEVADRIAANGPLAVRNIKASVIAALELQGGGRLPA